MNLERTNVQAATMDPGARLRHVLCTHQDEILQTWTSHVRDRQIAPGLSDEEIANHLPHILAQITRLVDAKEGANSAVERLGEVHAVDRLMHGFELDQVVLEYRLLRRIIMDTWHRTVGGDISVPELRALDEAIDESIVQAVVQYAGSRERLLKGLNQVSEAAATSTDLDTFLHALLQATVETLPSVDTAVVLVRERDRLHLKAAIGFEEALPEGVSFAVGEGFAGRVAELGEPVALTDAAHDPMVVSPLARTKGLRALYGVPLLAQGQVIGVAHIGSVGSDEFSEEHKLLFRTMAGRAASFISKARLQARLLEASEEAREAVATRDELLAIVSHDLRNQLGVVSNICSILEALLPKDDAKIGSALTTLQRTSVSMKRLVNDLLDTAALRSGKLSIAPEPVAVDSLMRRAYESHRSLAESVGIALAVQDDAGDTRVLCDRERIHQVFSNLIGNALRHCSKGDTVQLAAARRDDEVIFSVVDSGPGLPTGVAAHLFTPYRAGVRKGKQGTGLGLYISKGIIERHGGRLWHQRHEPTGAAFVFALPICTG